MRQLARVTMTMRDLDRLKCIQAVVDGNLKPGRAAERLGLTTRQVRRLTRRYAQEGPVGLISRHRNRPSNNRLEPSLAERVIGILRESYADFGPTLAAEKLRERHQIDLAKETVRQLKIAAGLWIPRRLRPPKIQQPRARRACLGELVQIDGCDHRWFEDRAPACTALVYVDDATSRLMVVLFTGAESTFAYFEATRQYLDRYGKPLAFYSDKASIFRVNQKSATGGDGHTQFGRALYELNIDGICANTPAAKGRVERAHQTLQDRLVKELRLHGISTIDAANALHADRSSTTTTAASGSSRGIVTMRIERSATMKHLDTIFAWRETRKVTKQPDVALRAQAVPAARYADESALQRQVRRCPAVPGWTDRDPGGRRRHCPTPPTTSSARSIRARWFSARHRGTCTTHIGRSAPMKIST